MTDQTNRARFKDKVAIVTGSGNGIGLGIAHAFAAEGAIAVIADINPTAGERAVAEIKAKGGRATSIVVDVSNEAQVEAMVAKTVELHGRIDILVNNAGVVLHKAIVDMARDEWDRQLAVQLTGPFLTSKHVARHMIARGGPGKVVNISSVSALMGRIKGAAHCAAKSGLTLLTKVLAMELAPYNVNVNALAPGLVDVPLQRQEETISAEYKESYLKMMPLNRLGQPSDIANGVLFLASSDADWITGQLFLVDGGMMAGHYSLGKLQDHAVLHGHST